MHFTKLFANSLLLFTVPALAAYPQADIPEIPIYSQNASQTDSSTCMEVNNELFSYDDVLDLLEEIEDGDVDERCNAEEIEGINRFMALLAKQGILPGVISQELALNRDIEALLSQSDSPWEFAYSLEDGYSIEPALFYGQTEAIQCKSWIKRRWDKTRKFVKEHKKEIIIGAVIIVAAAATIAVVVIATSTATAATVATGTALGVVASSGDSPSPGTSMQIASEPPVQEIELVAIPVQEVPALKEVIDAQIDSLKGQLAAEAIINPEKALNVESPSFVQDAREFGAAVAHSVLEGTATIVSAVPHFLEELRDVGERFIPKRVCDLQPSDTFNPLGNYEHSIGRGHKVIDWLFGVSQPQDLPVQAPEFTYAVLPPPGIVGPVVSSEGRVAPTQANATRGWTVGQKIQNRTFWGGIPKWSTVRMRHWKNRAEWAKSNPGHKYGAENIPRMERGLAPQKFNPQTGQMESMELHHTPPQRDGGLFDFIEVWPQEHAELDPHRYMGY